MAIVSGGGGGGSLSLPLNLGSGKFVIDANGNVTITPTGPPTNYPTDFAALTVSSAVEGAFLQAAKTSGMSNPQNLEIGGSGAKVVVGPNNTFEVDDTAYNPLFYVSAGAVEGAAPAISFFGGAAAAQQTLHSATATPEQIALALLASTFTKGD